MESLRGLSVQNGDTVSGIPRSALQQQGFRRLCFGTQSSRLAARWHPLEVDSTLELVPGVSHPACISLSKGLHLGIGGERNTLR